MKKVFVLLLVILVFMLKAFSQNMDTLQKSPTCFMIAHAAIKEKAKNVSDIYYIGDKINVKLKDKAMIKGKIDNLSRDSVITVDGTEIDFNTIDWIARAKKGPTSAIVGGLLVAGGAAVFVNLSGGNVNFDDYPGQLLLGAGLVTTGIVIITTHSKFKIESGDKMIFKELPSDPAIARN